MKGKQIIVVVCLATQAAICLYLSLLAYFLSAGSGSVSIAGRAQSSGWVRVGVMRFGQCMIGAGIFAAATFAWNRYLLRLSPRVVRWLALPTFLLIVASSLVGVVRFGRAREGTTTTKPRRW